MSPADHLELVLLRLALTHQSKTTVWVRQTLQDGGTTLTDMQIINAQRKVREMIDSWIRTMPDDDEDEDEV